MTRPTHRGRGLSKARSYESRIYLTPPPLGSHGESQSTRPNLKQSVADDISIAHRADGWSLDSTALDIRAWRHRDNRPVIALPPKPRTIGQYRWAGHLRMYPNPPCSSYKGRFHRADGRICHGYIRKPLEDTN